MMNGRMVSIGDGSNIAISVWGSDHRGIGPRNGRGAGVWVDTLVSIVPRLSLVSMKSIGVAIGARIVRPIVGVIGVWVNGMV